MTALFFALTALALITQVVASRVFAPATRVLLIGQAAFWTLSFLARPIYLLLVRPDNPALLGDYRLEWDNYGNSFNSVLVVSAVGQAAYTCTIVLTALLKRRSCSSGRGAPTVEEAISDRGGLPTAALIVYVLGWSGRLLSFFTAGSLVTALAPLADASAVLLILYRRPRLGLPASVGAVLIVEFGWSFISQSKEAFVVPLLALLLRFALQARFGDLRVATALAVPIAVLSYFVIQFQRGITSSAQLASSDNGWDALRAPIAALLERFDGFSAVTDAVALGPGHWLSVSGFGTRFLLFLLPKGPFVQLPATLGELWTQEVRSQTFVNQFQGVSLAAGPAAEGYAVAGWAGVVLETAILALATLLLGRWISTAGDLLTAFAVSVAFSTNLFEQGLLGLAAAVNKGLQFAIVLLVVSVLVRIPVSPLISGRF